MVTDSAARWRARRRQHAQAGLAVTTMRQMTFAMALGLLFAVCAATASARPIGAIRQPAAVRPIGAQATAPRQAHNVLHLATAPATAPPAPPAASAPTSSAEATAFPVGHVVCVVLGDTHANGKEGGERTEASEYQPFVGRQALASRRVEERAWRSGRIKLEPLSRSSRFGSI